MKKTLFALFTLVFIATATLADTKAGTNTPPILPPAILPDATAASAPPTVVKVNAPKHTGATKKKAAAPAKKILHAKPAVKKPAYSVPLTPGVATVAAKHVNVRGKPTINSEVLTRLNEGDTVNVLEEITRENTRADDPTAWAKIAAPSTAHLWVNAQFVDTNKLVTVKKLNIRTGPGENYSVAGQLAKGDTVNDLGSKDGWLEIAAGENHFAYVAAAYLKQEITTPAGTTNDWTTPAVEPAPVTTPVKTDTTPIATTTTDIASTNSNELVPAAQAGGTPAVKNSLVPKVVVPTEPRIVQREGVVRRTFSIQAPTSFALASPETGKTINYLYTSAQDLNLARYKGMHIIVTGEEGLDERWLNTPVITIQKIQVIE